MVNRGEYEDDQGKAKASGQSTAATQSLSASDSNHETLPDPDDEADPVIERSYMQYSIMTEDHFLIADENGCTEDSSDE